MIQDPLDVSLFDQVRLMLLILQFLIIATNDFYGSSKLYYKLILIGLEILNRQGRFLIISNSQICMAKRLHSLPYLNCIMNHFAVYLR